MVPDRKREQPRRPRPTSTTCQRPLTSMSPVISSPRGALCSPSSVSHSPCVFRPAQTRCAAGTTRFSRDFHKFPLPCYFVDNFFMYCLFLVDRSFTSFPVDRHPSHVASRRWSYVKDGKVSLEIKDSSNCTKKREWSGRGHALLAPVAAPTVKWAAGWTTCLVAIFKKWDCAE